MARRDAHFPNGLEPERPSLVFWLSALLTTEESSELVSFLEAQARFGTHADSTDLQPAYELYLLGRGKVAESEAGAAEVWARIGRRVEDCVAPFVRCEPGHVASCCKHSP